MNPHFASDLLGSRVALVTGGGTGIGPGIALALAARCDVAIVNSAAGTFICLWPPRCSSPA